MDKVVMAALCSSSSAWPAHGLHAKEARPGPSFCSPHCAPALSNGLFYTHSVSSPHPPSSSVLSFFLCHVSLTSFSGVQNFPSLSFSLLCTCLWNIHIHVMCSETHFLPVTQTRSTCSAYDTRMCYKSVSP